MGNSLHTFSNVTSTYLQTYRSILNNMIQSITKVEPSDSISYNFILQILPHCQAAIQMSENLLHYTTNIPLQNIALNIIQTQTKSIEHMLQIQTQCQSLSNSKQDLSLFQRKTKQIMHIMFFEMENAPTTNQINSNFIYEILPHYEGAIKMSENVLQYKIYPDLKSALETSRILQEKEVLQIQYLLQCIE